MRLYDGFVGIGRLAGIGFYIDRFYPLKDVETGHHKTGFYSPYAYLRYTLIDTDSLKTLNQVIAHRGDAVNAGGVAATAQADNAMTAMLGRLLAVAEAYPDLKANANFQQLQSELTEIEDDLQSARRYYNATVRDLNTRIQSFPNVLIARPMGFHEEEFYTDTDASIQVAPKVQFGAAKA